jgi:hypothetical protein
MQEEGQKIQRKSRKFENPNKDPWISFGFP